MTRAYLFVIIGFTSLIAFSNVRSNNQISYLDSTILVGLNNQSFPGLACVFVSKDTSWIGSYGVVKWADEINVDSDTKFQLGSVGKLLTAIAVLQQVEYGNLDLDENIINYLDIDLERIPTYDPLTLRHLLTHSSGMNDRNIGYLAKDSLHLESLKSHLENNLPSFYQSPGIDISYSNYGYALAGYIVERVSGLPFTEYIKLKILGRLEMNHSYVGFDFEYPQKDDYSQGHTKSDTGFEVNTEHARHAIPAGSFISTAEDMKNFLIGINNKDSTILKPSSWKLLFSRQFSNHRLLTGYSLGMEEQVINDQTFWAKGGMLSGFLSQAVFLPNGTSLFIVINTNDDTFLETFHSNFLNKFYPATATCSDVDNLPDLSRYAGEYRNSRYDREGVENIISLFRGAFYVWKGDSSLLVYHNDETHNYDYIGNNTFQNRNNCNQRMVFTEKHGGIDKLYRNVVIGGLSVPSAFEKTKWYNSPSFINEYYGFVPIGIALYFFVVFWRLFVSIIRKSKPKFWRSDFLPRINYWVASIGIILVFTHIFTVFFPLVKEPMQLLFGLQSQFQLLNKLTYIILFICALLWVLFGYAQLNKRGSVLSRILFGTYTLLMTIHFWFLAYWNFV